MISFTVCTVELYYSIPDKRLTVNKPNLLLFLLGGLAGGGVVGDCIYLRNHHILFLLFGSATLFLMFSCGDDWIQLIDFADG